MNFSNLNINNKLFEELEKNNTEWWQNLVNDPSIYIDIRKDNIINAYYRGASIIKLEYSNGLTGKIHYEYIPLKSEQPYVSYKFNRNSVEFNTEDIAPHLLNNFDSDVLKAIKSRINKFNDTSSEKCIQSELILKDGFFIDSEFAYKKDVEEELRIDLVRIDTDLKKIVFYEVKTILNPELQNEKIVSQLTKYKSFAENYSPYLLDHYKKLFEIKKKLNILPVKLAELNHIDDYTILNKPVLLIGDCTDEWIKKHKEMIDNKVNDIAYASLYLGKSTKNSFLPGKSKENRSIYSFLVNAMVEDVNNVSRT